MRVRLTMPMWFDLAFANFVTLLSEAGFKFGPIHSHLLSRRMPSALRNLTPGERRRQGSAVST
jgi:hypothetical protein